MAHFAKVNKETKIVEQVVVATQAWVYKQPDSEDWVQTSYNGNIRKNYAGIGFTYDSQLDAFIPPKPFASWVLDEDTCLWNAPVAMPTDGKLYQWDEPTTSWVEFVR